ncbi:hypothetical protein [uncultured Sphaerochaeta sp.]|uniref:hypothetical protein n=1 Tax=uncultured Sphaerochaeta sp. TaxID=886478 RepID=UPI002A0A20D4|nr:hypothetical protein [uncultured Sphaerochaeta sp.]
MQYLSRKQINLIVQKKVFQPYLSGNLPHRLEHDKFYYLTLTEAALFLGFNPPDFKDFFETYLEKIPHTVLGNCIVFERNTLAVWYAHTVLPVLNEASNT